MRDFELLKLQHLKMKKIILIICLLGVYSATAQQSAVVLDSLPIVNSIDTYTVYLPKDYDQERKWPVIMIFDPSGSSLESVEHFKSSADNYGYIIAAFKGIKNGTYQENLMKARSFYTSVLNDFPIEKNAIYLAGFSGGARLAVSIAVMSSQIKGVIACGASFANQEAYIPKANKFFYIGLVGDEDFNYNEMHNAQDYLEQKKFDANLLVFSGGHQWPPNHYIDKAVRLLTVKTINKNIRSAAEDELGDYFREELLFNQQLLSENLVHRAFQDMEVNMANYRFYIEKDSLRDLKKNIRKHKQYRKQRNTHNEVRRIEHYKYIDYLNYLPQDVATGDLQSMAYWEEEVDSIKNTFIASPKRAEKKQGIRLLSFLSIAASELDASYTEGDQVDNLLYIAILQTLIDEKDFDAYLKVLKYTVKESEYGMALYYLEKMLKNGFKDTQALDKQEGIALLRIQPEYNELLEAYGLHARY